MQKKEILMEIIRKIINEETKPKIYNSFKDKFGNEYKFDNYLDFSQFWFNLPRKAAITYFGDQFNQLQKAAANSKEARTRYTGK